MYVYFIELHITARSDPCHPSRPMLLALVLLTINTIVNTIVNTILLISWGTKGSAILITVYVCIHQ